MNGEKKRGDSPASGGRDRRLNDNKKALKAGMRTAAKDGDVEMRSKPFRSLSSGTLILTTPQV